MFKPSLIFSTDRSKAVLLLCIFLLFMFPVCLFCSLVINCLEMADFLSLLCVAFSCVFDSLPYSVQGQVLYLIVSIPGLLKCGAFKQAG